MARRIAPRRAESRRRSTASGSARTMGAAAPGDGGDLRCRDRKGAVTGPGILRMRPGLVTAPSRSRQGMRSRCRGSDGPAGARLRGRAGRAESHRRWRSGGWSRRIERGALRSTPPPPNVTQAADVPLEADVRFLRQPLLLRQTSSFSLEGASSSLGKRFTWHGERLLLAGERVLLARERVPLAWCTRPSRGWARPPRSRTRSPRMVHASFSPVGASSSLANAFTSHGARSSSRVGASPWLANGFTSHGARVLLAGGRVLLARERVHLVLVHGSSSPVGASPWLGSPITLHGKRRLPAEAPRRERRRRFLQLHSV